MFGVVYKVTNEVNGKVYIGQTVQALKNRKGEHIYAANTGRYKKFTRDYFHAAINKYGKSNFKWEIIECCNSREELDLAEEWYIRYYKTYVGLCNTNGYNLTMGGGGNSGLVFSKEHKRRISESKKGKKLSKETIEKIKIAARNNPNYGMRGKRCSAETKEKLRQVNLGKKVSEETRRKLSIAHKGHKRNVGFKHSKETKLKMSISSSGKLNPMYGTASPMTGRIGGLNSQSKKYIVTTPAGKDIFVHGIYNFCKNSKDKLHHSALIRVAKGKQKHHKGYLCRYVENGI